MTENATEAVVDAEEIEVDTRGKWYVFQVNQMLADKITRAIELEILNSTEIYQVLNVKETRPSKTNSKPRQTPLYPGYLFIRMSETVEAREALQNTLQLLKTPKLRLSAISKDEELRILSMIEKPIEHTLKDMYEIGNFVEIKDGPFAQFKGIVKSLHQSKEIAKIEISIFGRTTTADIELSSLDCVTE